jgi:hypothetical protein
MWKKCREAPFPQVQSFMLGMGAREGKPLKITIIIKKQTTVILFYYYNIVIIT